MTSNIEHSIQEHFEMIIYNNTSVYVTSCLPTISFHIRQKHASIVYDIVISDICKICKHDFDSCLAELSYISDMSWCFMLDIKSHTMTYTGSEGGIEKCVEKKAFAFVSIARDDPFCITLDTKDKYYFTRKSIINLNALHDAYYIVWKLMHIKKNSCNAHNFHIFIFFHENQMASSI